MNSFNILQKSTLFGLSSSSSTKEMILLLLLLELLLWIMNHIDLIPFHLDTRCTSLIMHAGWGIFFSFGFENFINHFQFYHLQKFIIKQNEIYIKLAPSRSLEKESEAKTRGRKEIRDGKRKITRKLNRKEYREKIHEGRDQREKPDVIEVGRFNIRCFPIENTFGCFCSIRDVWQRIWTRSSVVFQTESQKF